MLNTTMSVMLCTGGIFVLKENFLTSYLMPESKFILFIEVEIYFLSVF